MSDVIPVFNNKEKPELYDKCIEFLSTIMLDITLTGKNDYKESWMFNQTACYKDDSGNTLLMDKNFSIFVSEDGNERFMVSKEMFEEVKKMSGGKLKQWSREY